MSVINQVLSQLEQRGVHTVAEQPMVRAVQHNRRNVAMPLLAIGLILIAGIAAWQWVSLRKPAVSDVSVAPKAGNSPDSGEPEKLTPPKHSAATDGAASKLSFQLSSVPLPSPLRSFDKARGGQSSGQAASTKPLVLSEVEGSGQAASTSSGQALGNATNSLAANLVPDIGPGEVATISTANAKSATQAPSGAAPMKRVSIAQQADAEFRRAAGLMQQGRIVDAMAGYEAALRLDAGHEAARQALVALLLEDKRNVDAERVLQEGLNSKPEHTGFTMLLARLQAERGAVEQATATLEKSLQFAEAQDDYRAFLAALLQRQNRNEEAASHYKIVLQHAPNNGIWLMGYGISLQALQRNAEAKEAFKRALETKMLSPELQAFVQTKLKGL